MHFSYQGLYKYVDQMGALTAVRNGMTKEALGITLEVPADVLVIRPGLNHALGYMELMQLVAGVFNLDALKRVAPRANHSLFTDVMAYGPRSWYHEGNQFDDVLTELKHDPSSRRAVVNLAMPGEFPAERTCTQVLQFLIRDGQLHCHTFMRSWDLWFGLPYDLTIFGGATQLIAHCLALPLGTLRVTAGSAHIYEPHWEQELPQGTDHFGVDHVLPRRWDALQRWALANVNDKSWEMHAPLGIIELDTTGWLRARGQISVS